MGVKPTMLQYSYYTAGMQQREARGVNGLPAAGHGVKVASGSNALMEGTQPWCCQLQVACGLQCIPAKPYSSVLHACMLPPPLLLLLAESLTQHRASPNQVPVNH